MWKKESRIYIAHGLRACSPSRLKGRLVAADVWLQELAHAWTDQEVDRELKTGRNVNFKACPQ